MSNTFLTEITAIWGGRGSGKTTLARKLVMEADPAVVVFIDPLAKSGISPGEIKPAIVSGQRLIVCNSQRKSDQLAAIFVAYLCSTVNTPVYCVCDEAPAYLDTTTAAMNKIMFQGRHRAFGMMLLGQRPNAVNAQIRSQAAITYWMKITDHQDRSIAQQQIGPDNSRNLSSFKPGQFVIHPPKETT